VHIPDGFIAPQVYLPAYLLAGGAWAWAGRHLRRDLDEALVPRLAVLTALTYALGLIMLPLPGGTSGHAVGVGLLALIFGVRLAFVAYSLVLGLQSLLLGAGGVTALPINALCIGLVGSATAVGVRRALAAAGDTAAVAAAAAASVLLPALLVALVLGLQPLVARGDEGAPLFFPFGLEVTLPAVLLPHLLIAGGEVVLTVLVWRYARERGWSAA
jgi:cobalt/nickel transport system permease protein